MSKIKVEQAMKLHREAMNFSEEAQITKIKKEDENSVSNFFGKAFELEKEAAMLLKDEEEDLVTRAVLFRSAAVLALDCNQSREAEKLIGLGLSKETPPQIANELRDLYEEINFKRYMETHGINLLPGQIQASFVGDAIYSGLSEVTPIINRIDMLRKMFLRTAQRLQNIPFKKSGRMSKSLESFGLYISPPQPGSIAFTLQVGGSEQELDFGDKGSKSNIINNVLECLNHFENDRREKLKELIVDEAYYGNFISLAEEIKPDGEKVKSIALATENNHVQLRTRRPESLKTKDSNSDKKEQVTEKPKTAEGELLLADATGGNDIVIQIIPNNRKENSVKLHVPPEREDIIQNYWKKEVFVNWENQNRKKVLTNVRLTGKQEEF